MHFLHGCIIQACKTNLHYHPGTRLGIEKEKLTPKGEGSKKSQVLNLTFYFTLFLNRYYFVTSTVPRSLTTPNSTVTFVFSING